LLVAAIGDKESGIVPTEALHIVLDGAGSFGSVQQPLIVCIEL